MPYTAATDRISISSSSEQNIVLEVEAHRMITILDHRDGVRTVRQHKPID